MSGRAPGRGGKRGGGASGGASTRTTPAAAPAAATTGSPFSTMGSMRDALPSQGEAAAAAGIPTGGARQGDAPRQLRESDLMNPQTDEARQQAVQMLQSLTLTNCHPRPSFGTSGRPIPVVANMFKVKNQGKDITHYDVTIEPVVRVVNQKPMPVARCREIWKALQGQLNGQDLKAYQDSAYDGQKNVFSPSEFSFGTQPHTFTVFVADRPATGTTASTTKPGAGPPSEPSGQSFKITIKKAADIDLGIIEAFVQGRKQGLNLENSVLNAITSLNILLRQDPSDRYTPIGRGGQRFFPSDGATTIPSGAVVAAGFMQSFRPGIKTAAVQIDTAYSAFLQPGPMMDVVARILGRNQNAGFRGGRGGGRGGRGGPPPGRGGRGGFQGGGGGGGGGTPEPIRELSQQDIVKVRKILKMCKFKTTHRASSKEYTIMSITLQGADQLMFTMEARDGQPERKMSVAEYFRVTYNRPLQYPRLPCIQYGKKNYVPLEYTVLSPFNSLPPTKLTPDQSAEMIRVAAKPPLERRDLIAQWRSRLNYDALPKLRSWGITVDKNMTDVTARVLNPPNVKYGGTGAAGLMRPAGGAWNLRGKKFIGSGAALKSWAVVSFDHYTDEARLRPFLSQLIQTLQGSGIAVLNTNPPIFGPNPCPQSQAAMRDVLRTAGKGAFDQSKGVAPQLIVCILPGRDTWSYELMKRTAAMSLTTAVPTQCLQASKLANPRGLDQYCANVSMKIAAKLGNTTHGVPISDMPGVDNKTMIVGADVTHAPARSGSDVSPSIAATVATYEATQTKYLANIRLQQGRTEPITDLASMMVSHMQDFQRFNKAPPEKIIFYRDGVSEGQYYEVVQVEVKAIKEAAKTFGPKYKPKVTFVIAAKRHNMRFFSKDGKDVDRSGNLPAGTCVDTVVCHPFAFDFYLQAHAGLVGTARPCHYSVLEDDNNFKPDDLQRLTNALCYAYPRATRSVSLVTPAYLADIICTQTRAFIYAGDDDSVTPSQTSGGGSGARPQTVAFDPLQIDAMIKRGKGASEARSSFEKVHWFM